MTFSSFKEISDLAEKASFTPIVPTDLLDRSTVDKEQWFLFEDGFTAVRELFQDSYFVDCFWGYAVDEPCFMAGRFPSPGEKAYDVTLDRMSNRISYLHLMRQYYDANISWRTVATAGSSFATIATLTTDVLTSMIVGVGCVGIERFIAAKERPLFKGEKMVKGYLKYHELRHKTKA